MGVSVAEVTILTDGADVRILYPLPGERLEAFHERMETMGRVLGEIAPGSVSVILDAAPGCPVCVVTSRRPLDDRPSAAEADCARLRYNADHKTHP
jgi:hypothetical protein